MFIFTLNIFMVLASMHFSFESGPEVRTTVFHSLSTMHSALSTTSHTPEKVDQELDILEEIFSNPSQIEASNLESASSILKDVIINGAEETRVLSEYFSTKAFGND